MAVQLIQNDGDFSKVDPWQVARGAAIGGATGGMSALGRSLVTQAGKAGVATAAVKGANAARDAAIVYTGAVGEAVNAGVPSDQILSDAAISVATSRLGGEVFDAIEGGDKIAREVGEQMVGAGGDIARGAASGQEPAGPLQVVIRGPGGCVNPDCSRPD